MALRFLNAIYSFFSYGIARYTGFSVSPPLPPALSVELTTVCNLSCPECITGSASLKRRKGHMDYALATKISSELEHKVLSSYLYFQGEPLLHPQFFDVVRLFSRMNPAISTNGHFLDLETCRKLAESDLKRIIISFDGVTQESYSKYRKGGDIETVREGIMTLLGIIREERSDLSVELHFLVGKHNEHEINAASTFAKNVGIKFKVKKMQISDPSRVGEWIPSDPSLSRYGHDGRLKPAGGYSRKGCLRMWTTAVVTVDGDVIPCCFDKNADHIMGNIKENTFRQIWYNEKYRSFRKKVLRDRCSVSLCSECPQGINLYLKR